MDKDRKEKNVPFLCECGNVGCEKCVPMTPVDYDELPLEPPGLALSPGHDGDFSR